MSTSGTLYVIQNTTNGKYIGNYKVALFDQQQPLHMAHFFHSEQSAKTNCKRLNNYVKKYREQAADPFYKGYKETHYLDVELVVLSVEIKLA